jgi:hypothetical protein
MDAKNRLAEGDKVRVIYRESPYFDKKGKLIKIIDKSVTIIDHSSKVVSSETEYSLVVKLDDKGITETFTFEQLEKVD